MLCLSTNKQPIKGEAIDYFGAHFGVTASGPKSLHSCSGRKEKNSLQDLKITDFQLYSSKQNYADDFFCSCENKWQGKDHVSFSAYLKSKKVCFL